MFRISMIRTVYPAVRQGLILHRGCARLSVGRRTFLISRDRGTVTEWPTR